MRRGGLRAFRADRGGERLRIADRDLDLFGGVARYTPVREDAPPRPTAADRIVDSKDHIHDSKGSPMKSLLSSRPVLWFLFLFNAAVAVAVAVGGHHLHIH